MARSGEFVLRLARLGVRAIARPEGNDTLAGDYFVYREEPLEKGNAGSSGQIDLLIFFKGARLGVEVKTERHERPAPADVWHYYHLYLTMPIKLAEPAAVSKTLDDLILEWVGYCESIGGLKLKKYPAP